MVAGALREALVAIVLEADQQLGSGTVDAILTDRRGGRATFSAEALGAVLRVAELHCGSDAVRGWLLALVGEPYSSAAAPRRPSPGHQRPSSPGPRVSEGRRATAPPAKAAAAVDACVVAQRRITSRPTIGGIGHAPAGAERRPANDTRTPVRSSSADGRSGSTSSLSRPRVSSVSRTSSMQPSAGRPAPTRVAPSASPSHSNIHGAATTHQPSARSTPSAVLASLAAAGSSARVGQQWRQQWSSQVAGAARQLGSLAIHMHIRTEALTCLHKTLEGGYRELMKHALQSNDFFCTTSAKLMPLLSFQLQSLDPAIVKLVMGPVAIMADIMGPLFFEAGDTYVSRVLWLLDCPAMAPIYEDIASHVSLLAQKVRHERLLCHLVEHVRWLDGVADEPPHSVQSAPVLVNANVSHGKDAPQREASRGLCESLSLSLLEWAASRMCSKVQFVIDDLIHPNLYTLPLLDDRYVSAAQRKACYPPAEGVDGGSCPVEMLRRALAKREGIHHRDVTIVRHGDGRELSDLDDYYDGREHLIVKAFEHMATRKGDLKGHAQSKPASPLRPRSASSAQFPAGGSAARNEVSVLAATLSKTLTNDDFRHTHGHQQSAERVAFVTGIAKTVWDSIVLPIVGDDARPLGHAPHAHHVLEVFLMLFPVQGGLFFGRDISLEHRKTIARRLLDRTTAHAHNFCLFMVPLLQDLTPEELGGAVDSPTFVPPVVDSPQTRLGQIHHRKGGAAVSVATASVGRGSIGTAIRSQSPPNLFQMMGRREDPRVATIPLRQPSPTGRQHHISARTTMRIADPHGSSTVRKHTSSSKTVLHIPL